MAELNLQPSEQVALRAIDAEVLDALIEECLNKNSIAPLRSLSLRNCGPFVERHLTHFEEALTAVKTAKTARSIEVACEKAKRSGDDLISAVLAMIQRLQTEERDANAFHVYDDYVEPFSFSSDLDVTIRFRWKRPSEEDWSYGSFTIRHTVPPVSPFYGNRVGMNRKRPSPSKLKMETDARLSSAWHHMRRVSLYSVRDFFRSGGDGAAIPRNFIAKADASGGLNNCCADFWNRR